MTVFSTPGDLGDSLYQLSTIRSMGGGELVCYPSTTVREPWTREKFDRAKWFFQLQPYITGVRLADTAEGIDLDKWRQYRPRGRRQNLADFVAEAFRVRPWPRREPWATVDRHEHVFARDIVIHRSPRYRSQDFPWGEIVKRWRTRAYFVGSVEEAEDFERLYGDVPHYPTPTLVDLARLIAGCRLFIGNQSSPRALAEALKKPVWVGVPRHPQNTTFVRPDAWYGSRELRRVAAWLGERPYQPDN